MGGVALGAWLWAARYSSRSRAWHHVSSLVKIFESVRESFQQGETTGASNLPPAPDAPPDPHPQPKAVSGRDTDPIGHEGASKCQEWGPLLSLQRLGDCVYLVSMEIV